MHIYSTTQLYVCLQNIKHTNHSNGMSSQRKQEKNMNLKCVEVGKY